MVSAIHSSTRQPMPNLRTWLAQRLPTGPIKAMAHSVAPSSLLDTNNTALTRGMIIPKHGLVVMIDDQPHFLDLCFALPPDGREVTISPHGKLPGVFVLTAGSVELATLKIVATQPAA